MRDYAKIKLDRFPSPPDERDYRLSHYLAASPADTSPPAPAEYADKTVREIAEQGISWSMWVRIWSLVKTLPRPSPPGPAVGMVWQDDAQLDQDATGHCVGFGGAQWGNTLPVDDQYQNQDGHALYYEAKAIELGVTPRTFDPPGSGPAVWENGAYVRDGMKALKARGRLAAYASARSVANEVVPWLCQHGPVLVGTDWYEGMDKPDAQGVMSVSGQVRGGHCWTLDGYIPAGIATPEGVVHDRDVVRMQNSWGSGWAVGGYAYITIPDLQKLLNAHGEAWASVELPA